MKSGWPPWKMIRIVSWSVVVCAMCVDCCCCGVRGSGDVCFFAHLFVCPCWLEIWLGALTRFPCSESFSRSMNITYICFLVIATCHVVTGACRFLDQVDEKSWDSLRLGVLCTSKSNTYREGAASNVAVGSYKAAWQSNKTGTRSTTKLSHQARVLTEIVLFSESKREKIKMKTRSSDNSFIF